MATSGIPCIASLCMWWGGHALKPKPAKHSNPDPALPHHINATTAHCLLWSNILFLAAHIYSSRQWASLLSNLHGTIQAVSWSAFGASKPFLEVTYSDALSHSDPLHTTSRLNGCNSSVVYVCHNRALCSPHTRTAFDVGTAFSSGSAC